MINKKLSRQFLILSILFSFSIISVFSQQKSGTIVTKTKTFIEKTFLGIGNDKRKIYYAPSTSLNSYDGCQIGIAIYNSPAKGSPFQFAINPMFGLNSTTIIGGAEVMYYFGKKENKFNHFVALQLRSYNFQNSQDNKSHLRFTRLSPTIALSISNTEKNQQWLKFQGLGILEESFNYDSAGVRNGKTINSRATYRADWHWQKKDGNNPFLFKIGVEGANFNNTGNQYYLKIQAEANVKINYGGTERGVWIRAYAGGFAMNSMRERKDLFSFPVQLISRASSDYQYDNGYFGRTDQENIWSQQVSSNEGGGFKMPIPASSDDGRSNTAVAAINIKADLPFKFFVKIPSIRLRPYIDIGYSVYTGPTGGNISPVMVNGGIMIDIGEGAAGLFFPIAGTDNLMNKISGGFQMNMHKLNPLNKMKKKNGYPVLF
jgi:hypothetical protein